MINTGISQENRKKMATTLNILLADEYVLYTKTYKFHWNLKSKHFGALHAFFQDQFEQIIKFVDAVAERIQQIGHVADGTLTEFLQKTTLTELPGHNPTDLEIMQLLLDDHESIVRNLRDIVSETTEFNDHGTNNFLTDLIEKHEKIAWMLRSHL